MNKPAEYGICIRLIRQDEADLYEGRVKELPDLKVYCETYSDAYEELVDAIGAAQELFDEQDRTFPAAEPIEEDFSGRITLRMSKSLHRCVHFKAVDDAISLNQWIVEAVACRAEGRRPIVVANPVQATVATASGVWLHKVHYLTQGPAIDVYVMGAPEAFISLPNFRSPLAHLQTPTIVDNRHG